MARNRRRAFIGNFGFLRHGLEVRFILFNICVVVVVHNHQSQPSRTSGEKELAACKLFLNFNLTRSWNM
ncbi:hypothetical protein PoMZ_03814 [Pyricularia oryzae]|uniref:Uncharacterized protein n=1 Tax=Pyricularia oryzae TaxID=318829 RepID=A0A4P7NC65_PYROR|nr:hypothetical protein PoMZ_03814 [Pyricularia oryzae]